jgi:hypothetical protein
MDTIDTRSVAPQPVHAAVERSCSSSMSPKVNWSSMFLIYFVVIEKLYARDTEENTAVDYRRLGDSINSVMLPQPGYN